MQDTDALRTVKKWLAKRQLLQGPLSHTHQPLTQFATALRDAIDPRQRCSPPFASHTDAAAYTRQVAGWIKGSEAADKLPNLREERSIQDRKNGYRLLKKQRQAKRARQTLKDQRERVHADAWADYRDRLEGDWSIIKR